MQPYFFPYVGYFQLIHASDKFVFYDDVAFIKQGWINRNNILLQGKAHLFSIPVSNISSFESIAETKISYKVDWTVKFIKTIELSYKKAPNFDEIFPMLSALVLEKPETIAELAKKSIKLVLDHVGTSVDVVNSSAKYKNENLKAQERIIDICKMENAKVYNNPIGGLSLYDRGTFNANKIELKFVKPNAMEYSQFNNTFVPYLSTIDLMMFNSASAIKTMFTTFELV